MNHQSTHIPRRSIATLFMILLLDANDASLTVSTTQIKLAIHKCTIYMCPQDRINVWNNINNIWFAILTSGRESEHILASCNNNISDRRSILSISSSVRFIWIKRIVTIVRLTTHPLHNRPIVLMHCFKHYGNKVRKSVHIESDANGSRRLCIWWA